MAVKDMKRSEWKRITSKKQIIENYECHGAKGKISLLKILAVSEPFVRQCGSDFLTLADAGYSWLQLAMENDFAWFTVMFDDHDRFLQIYTDMTSGNRTDIENPCFEDMYIDFVIDRDHIDKLDQCEAEAALHNGLISPEQYDLLLKHTDMTDAYLMAHQADLIAFFEEEQKKLKRRIDQDEGHRI